MPCRLGRRSLQQSCNVRVGPTAMSSVCGCCFSRRMKQPSHEVDRSLHRPDRHVLSLRVLFLANEVTTVQEGARLQKSFIGPSVRGCFLQAKAQQKSIPARTVLPAPQTLHIANTENFAYSQHRKLCIQPKPTC
jgi:hypothetical protein